MDKHIGLVGQAQSIRFISKSCVKMDYPPFYLMLFSLQ